MVRGRDWEEGTGKEAHTDKLRPQSRQDWGGSRDSGQASQLHIVSPPPSPKAAPGPRVVLSSLSLLIRLSRQMLAQESPRALIVTCSGPTERQVESG